jgi:hypothetical protein
LKEFTMRTALLLALCLLPAAVFAQSEAPPPPDEAQDVEAVRPPDAAPQAQPPAPPAAPPARPESDDDQVGILQQHASDNAGVLQSSPEAYAAPQSAPAPTATGQWVFTSQYGWVWMPYGNQYVDEGYSGSPSPYAYVYAVNIGWSWVAAPWLWGWGPYPYFGIRGPHYYGWYRGLYRAGYGWGHYRGGYRGGSGARPVPHAYSRGGGAVVHSTRPSGVVNRGVSRPAGGPRTTARPSGGWARPSGGSRPTGGWARPGGGAVRPSGGGVRPGGASARPSGGAARPSGGGFHASGARGGGGGGGHGRR